MSKRNEDFHKTQVLQALSMASVAIAEPRGKNNLEAAILWTGIALMRIANLDGGMAGLEGALRELRRLEIEAPGEEEQ